MRNPISAAVLRRDDARPHSLPSAAAQRIGALLLDGDDGPAVVARKGALATLACCGFFLLIVRTDFHAANSTGFLATPTIGASGSHEVPTEDPRMRLNSNFGAMAAAVALSIGGQAVAQDAVQWRVVDGGNGHWYRAVPSACVTWADSLIAARSAGGDLVSITSDAENNFVFQASLSIWSANGGGPWLGGYQDVHARDFAEPAGGWRWTSGEPWSYTSWYCTNPSNNEGNENVLNFAINWTCGSTPFPAWNDASIQCNIGYVVEWSADCNNDGIVDYGQILAGELADANLNNIPDCCEGGASCNPCPGDVDNSGAVNGVDLAAILNSWGTSGGKYPGADVNHDSVVNGSDLAIVLNGWGPCP